jgi:hypothetical protein
MTDVVEMETFDLCFAAGRLKRPASILHSLLCRPT